MILRTLPSYFLNFVRRYQSVATRNKTFEDHFYQNAFWFWNGITRKMIRNLQFVKKVVSKPNFVTPQQLNFCMEVAFRCNHSCSLMQHFFVLDGQGFGSQCCSLERYSHHCTVHVLHGTLCQVALDFVSHALVISMLFFIGAAQFFVFFLHNELNFVNFFTLFNILLTR